MATAQTTTTDTTPTTRDQTERAVFTELLLKALTWNGLRIGLDGKVEKGTTGNMKPGTRRTVWDSWQDEFGKTTGLCIQITEKGAKSFQVMRRVKGEKRPVKVTLGRFDQGDLTLAEARARAQALKKDMRDGINPVQVRREEKVAKQAAAEAARIAEAKKTTHRIDKVFDAYCKAKLDKLKSGQHPRGYLEREILPRFGDMAIQDLRRGQVVEALNEIIEDEDKRRTSEISYAALHTLNALRAFYSWAICSNRYDGLEHSPCDHLKGKAVKEIINPQGVPMDRERVLSNPEISLFWRATADLPYVYGPLARLLFLSGCRLREIAHASRPELAAVPVTDDTGAETEVMVDALVIPAGRMKGKREHVVPLVPAMQSIIDTLPRWNAGEHLFSMTGGERPFTSMARLKEVVDAAMLRLLRQDLGVPVENAALRTHLGLAADAEIPAAYRVELWRLHDLRRTARTLLARLKVPHEVAEAVLAHKLPGVAGVYNRHPYIVERREALQKLADIVARIAGTNVVRFPVSAKQAATA
jgi:integrase